MPNRILIICIYVFLMSCFNKNGKENQHKKLNENLTLAIENYIHKNSLTPPCMVHVRLVNYRYDYKAFNISTDLSTDCRFSSLCIKSKVGVDICFYSGLENYFNNQDNLHRTVNKNCINADMIVTIDSAGVWKTYDNIALFPSCTLPDNKVLTSKMNK